MWVLALLSSAQRRSFLSYSSACRRSMTCGNPGQRVTCPFGGNPREKELVVPLSIFALFLVVFGFTTGEFVVAGILPDVAADLGVSIPAAAPLTTRYRGPRIIRGPVV